MLNTLPVLYICIVVLLQNKSIWSFGTQFLIQSCFNFGCNFFFILELLYYGAAANRVDDLFKSKVMEVRTDQVQLRIATNL